MLIVQPLVASIDVKSIEISRLAYGAQFSLPTHWLKLFQAVWLPSLQIVPLFM